MKIIKKLFAPLNWLHLLLISIGLAGSCINFSELKSPLDGIKLIINYNIFNTFLSFSFVDSETGALIGATGTANVAVKISGASSPAVVDQLGNHEETYNSVFGFLSLALNPNDPWKPSVQSKQTFQIDATSAGYKAVNLTLQLDSTGKYDYRVMMEKINAGASGYKKYFFLLNLNGNGELKEDFSFITTGNEAALKLKKGTQFQNATGGVEKGTPVNLTFTVYTRLNAAPVPGALLENIQLKDQTVRQVALDIYRVLDVKFTNKTSDLLASTVINPIVLRYKIDSLAYSPVTKKAILPGNDLKTYTWLQGKTLWQQDDSMKLGKDANGYYAESAINSSGVHAAGMHIGLCAMSGQQTFALQGLFPSYPVSVLIYLYRKIDSRYIGNTRLDALQNGSAVPMNVIVPENTPVRSTLNSYSGTNQFTANPNYFDYEAGCGSFGQLGSTLTYKPPVIIPTVTVSGHVKITVGNGFSTDPFMISASIYQASDNSVLWSKNFSVGKTSNEFDISAALPVNTNSYIRVVAVDGQNAFNATPANLSFNTSSATGLAWNFSIVPINASVNLNFNFTRNINLPNSNYLVKAVLTNMADQSSAGEIIFHVIPGQTAYTTKLSLARDKQYKINLKRVDGAPLFMAYPYEFVPGTITQTDYTYDVELSDVVIKQLALKAKVVCDKTEIIPTLHGYYKTVWDDQWQQTDIVNGVFNLACQINATYVVGLIVNGKMETDTYQFDGTKLDFNFALDASNCATMGW